VMINPVILKTSEEMVIWEEACLSLPNENGNVKRYQSIHVEYIDTKWNKQKKKYKGFNAVIVQHEIDHLDGVLFTDKCIEKKQ
jgi:peptide deformylase